MKIRCSLTFTVFSRHIFMLSMCVEKAGKKEVILLSPLTLSPSHNNLTSDSVWSCRHGSMAGVWGGWVGQDLLCAHSLFCASLRHLSPALPPSTGLVWWRIMGLVSVRQYLFLSPSLLLWRRKILAHPPSVTGMRQGMGRQACHPSILRRRHDCSSQMWWHPFFIILAGCMAGGLTCWGRGMACGLLPALWRKMVVSQPCAFFSILSSLSYSLQYGDMSVIHFSFSFILLMYHAIDAHPNISVSFSLPLISS